MDHVASAPARIYRPAKSTMQSGTAHSSGWVLEFVSPTAKKADALMGWQVGASTQSQISLRFPDLAAAEAYAQKKGIAYTVQADTPRTLKIQTYAENFL